LSSISKEIASNQVSRYQKTIGQYNTLITDAKSKGYNVATKLLQHFLDGSGTTMKISSKWLQKNGAVQDAEEKNQERFEEQILDKYESLKNGQTFLLEDYWDAMATSSVFSELYYASGTFTVKSSASIELARNGENASAMGKVTIIWQDTYDWHDGLSAFIPGYGTISDSDALFLQQFGKAKPFNMESSWQRSLSGNISINQYWLDSSDFNWK